jgi:hypothetical protein
MPKRNIYIYMDDGLKFITHALMRVASVIESPELTQTGTGKQRKSLFHVIYKNDDGTNTIVKSFFRVMRNGTEEYIAEVLNAENSDKFLEIKRKADEIVARHRMEDK